MKKAILFYVSMILVTVGSIIRILEVNSIIVYSLLVIAFLLSVINVVLTVKSKCRDKNKLI